MNRPTMFEDIQADLNATIKSLSRTKGPNKTEEWEIMMRFCKAVGLPKPVDRVHDHPDTERLQNWMWQGRFDMVSCWVLEEWSIPVDPAQIEHWFLMSGHIVINDPRMWLKNRLGEQSHFDGAGVNDTHTRYSANKLHVFFITIEETPHQLFLLGTPADMTIKCEQAMERVARSKMFRTNLKVRPIDRVAYRVALPIL